MRACTRCGFLNPDKAEFCLKCRLDMKEQGGGESVRLVGNALSGSAAGRGPVDDTAPQKPRLGEGGLDEPPSWAQKPEIKAPAPDLDETFAGRGPDAGGYQVGGVSSTPQASGPAVSDAFAIMTSGNALAGSEQETPRRRKRGKTPGGPRPAKRKADRPPPGLPEGSITGLPPDLGASSFKIGMQEEDYRPQSPAPRGTPGPGQGPPGTTRPVIDRAPASMPFEAQPPPPRPSAGQGGQWPPAQAAPPPPLGASGPPATPAPVKRPVPRHTAAAGGAGAARAPRTRPHVSMPDLSFLRKALDVFTPRVIVGVIGGIIVLFAAIYLLAGGSYFSSDARDLLESSQRAMRSLGSFHMQAEVTIQAEKAGTITTAVTADVSKDRDMRAAFADAVYHPAIEYVTASGKTYKKSGAAAWEVSSDSVNPDLTSAALFSGASGSVLVDRQAVDGVECDHIAFEAGPDFARSFFPGVETTEATRAAVEIWVDPQQKYVRHIRLDANNLETIKLGRFNCHIEATLSGFGAPMEIAPPM